MSVNALPDFTALWDFSDPAATELKFREILPAAEASGDELYLLELLTQIARSQGLQKKFDMAHTTLDRAEAMLAAGDAAFLQKGRLRYLLERGRAFNSAEPPELAQPLFLEAYELGQTTQYDSLTIDAAHMLGIVTKDQESLDWNLAALKLAEQTSDSKAAQWKGALYNNIAWTYMDMDQPQQALDLFQKGLEFRESNEHPQSTRMIAHWSVARALRGLGKHDEALAKLQYIAGIFAEHAGDGFWYEEMAENLFALDRQDEASDYFEAAFTLLSAEQAWLLEAEPERIARLNELSGKQETQEPSE